MTTIDKTAQFPIKRVRIKVPAQSQPSQLPVGTRKKHNWVLMEQMYVEGVANDQTGEHEWPTLEEVAKHFGCHPNQVRAKASKERWRIKQRGVQGRISETRQKAEIKELGRANLQLNTKSLSGANVALSLIAARMADLERDLIRYDNHKAQLYEERGDQGSYISLKELRSPVYHLEMLNLTTAMAKALELGRNALGEANIQRLEISGPNGGPIEHHSDIEEEMVRDDTERLRKLMVALEQANLIVPLEIEDADVVEDEADHDGLGVRGEDDQEPQED